jgi:hypothetical protein
MSNLMVHCGGYRLEGGRHNLGLIRTPEPVGKHFPIPHRALLDTVEAGLSAAGLRIVQEQHAISHEGQRYFGLLQIANGKEGGDGYAWTLGLRNSHDQTFAAGLVAGSRVFVCDNLAFSGEVKIARKHTRFILDDLPKLTQIAVGRLTDYLVDNEARFGCYREHGLAPSEVHDLVIRAYDSGVIATSKIGKVLDEYRAPHHPEFRDTNAWCLFNAFTQILKGLNPWDLAKRTETLHGLFDGVTGAATLIETKRAERAEAAGLDLAELNRLVDSDDVEVEGRVLAVA